MAYRYIVLASIAILALVSSCKQNTSSNDVAPSSQNESLKALDWLAGDWVDDADNIDVNYHFYWNYNHHVLIQNFTVNSPEHSNLNGQQWILWDPVRDALRSWIVDSDGGFGESSWSKQGDSWYVNTTYTLEDGRQATATHIYTKLDNNTFTFASEGRDIDGVVLPNIGPFKVIRKR